MRTILTFWALHCYFSCNYTHTSWAALLPYFRISEKSQTHPEFCSCSLNSSELAETVRVPHNVSRLCSCRPAPDPWLVARFPLLIARCSFSVARCSFSVAHCPFSVARCSFFVATFPLLLSRASTYSPPLGSVARCSLLVARFSLPVACFLLEKARGHTLTGFKHSLESDTRPGYTLVLWTTSASSQDPGKVI